MKHKNTPYQEPQVFYGLHFAPGVCTHEQGDKTLIIYISSEVAKEMDPTFQAKPVVVQHLKEDVDLATIKEKADGWVSESFFNEADGMHWAKFTAITDRALDAIKQGWFLSNCFEIPEQGPGGKWHGVPYDVEALRGEYEHLAIVPVPRYKESVIMTPEQFKEYNENLMLKLEKQKNSEGEETQGGDQMFKIFNRSAVDAKEAEGLLNKTLLLPKSGLEVTIMKLANDADEAAEKEKGGKVEAKPEHVVTLHNGEKTTVGDLLKRHEDCYNALEEMKDRHPEEFGEDGKVKEKNAEDPEADEKDKENERAALAIAEHEEEEIEKRRQENASKIDKLRNSLGLEPRGDAAEKAAAEAARKREAAMKVRNAADAHDAGTVDNRPLEIGVDQFARGKNLYGSKK